MPCCARIGSMFLVEKNLEPRYIAANGMRREMPRQRFGAFARDPALRWMGNVQFVILGMASAPCKRLDEVLTSAFCGPLAAESGLPRGSNVVS